VEIVQYAIIATIIFMQAECFAITVFIFDSRKGSRTLFMILIKDGSHLKKAKRDGKGKT